MTSPLPLPVLRQLLNEATDLPWELQHDDEHVPHIIKGNAYVCGPADEYADTVLIHAAVNHLPALLDLVERQAAAIEAVQELHRPLMNSPERELACPDCLGGINVSEDEIDEPRPCGCWGLLTPICGTCADFHGNRRYPMQWPCPTAKALSGITPTTEEN